MRHPKTANIPATDFSLLSPGEGPPEIGQEIQRLRLTHNLTLDELAARSGVSKSILSQIERDKSNPTLSTIWRISRALERRPETLLQSRDKPPHTIENMASNATPEVTSEDGLCRLRILGSLDTVNAVQWYEVRAEPGAVLISESHGEGTTEHLSVIEGTLTVESGGERMTARTGQTLRYRSDGPHKVLNETDRPACAFMVCILAMPRG